MRDISVSEHISKSLAMEYIAAAVAGNTDFELRSICGFDVDFVDIDSRHKEHHSERLARVVACNQHRTVVAVAYVSPADCGGCQPQEQNAHADAPILRMLCSCCGAVTRGRQWHNRDTGWGLCVDCIDRCHRNETLEQFQRLYGDRGVHYDLPAA